MAVVDLDDLTMDQVEAAHTIDDLCKQVATLRKAINEARRLLADVPHAITNGSPGVATEFVDRAMTALDKAVS